jgi:hypothetical protein
MPDPLWLVLGTVSLAMVVNLWVRGRGSRTKKAIWSLVLFVPALGPLFYLAQYSAPGEQEESLQARDNDDDEDDIVGPAREQD